eukprot:scaffold967_cov321-Pavlova_lutheri.AAC.36
MTHGWSTVEHSAQLLVQWCSIPSPRPPPGGTPPVNLVSPRMRVSPRRSRSGCQGCIVGTRGSVSWSFPWILFEPPPRRSMHAHGIQVDVSVGHFAGSSIARGVWRRNSLGFPLRPPSVGEGTIRPPRNQQKRKTTKDSRANPRSVRFQTSGHVPFRKGSNFGLRSVPLVGRTRIAASRNQGRTARHQNRRNRDDCASPTHPRACFYASGVGRDGGGRNGDPSGAEGRTQRIHATARDQEQGLGTSDRTRLGGDHRCDHQCRCSALDAACDGAVDPSCGRQPGASACRRLPDATDPDAETTCGGTQPALHLRRLGVRGIAALLLDQGTRSGYQDVRAERQEAARQDDRDSPTKGRRFR